MSNPTFALCSPRGRKDYIVLFDLLTSNEVFVQARKWMDSYGCALPTDIIVSAGTTAFIIPPRGRTIPRPEARLIWSSLVADGCTQKTKEECME